MARYHGIGYHNGLPSIRDHAYGAGSGATSTLAVQHAQKARFLSEWINGAQMDGVESCAPRTPHTGSCGHDHSGGVMGRPIQRVLWATSLGLPYNIANSDAITNGYAPQAVINPGGLVASPANVPIYVFDSDLYGIWIPGAGSSDVDSPHRRNALGLLIHTSAAITVYAQWRNAGITGAVESITGANNDYKHWIFDGTDGDYVPLTPGQFNNAHLTVWCEGDGVTTTAYTACLCSVAIYQISDTP
jgi:hypothetical protein